MYVYLIYKIISIYNNTSLTRCFHYQSEFNHQNTNIRWIVIYNIIRNIMYKD
nr:MAG TPA: hypothetical protein [Bacteriophage sp.]